MKHSTECTATLSTAPAAVWAAWADMTSYPAWDPREQELRLDGPFATGTPGWSKQAGRRPGSPFTLTLVEPMTRWVNELPLPGGRLVIDHQLAAVSGGRSAVRKTYIAHGPMAVLFKLFFGRGIRREMPASFAALEAEAARRVSAA